MKKLIYLLNLLLVPTLVLGAVVIISQTSISPESPRVYFVTGNILFQKGDYAGAITNFERAVALDESYEEALNNLAVSYNKLGFYDKASDALKELTTISPENPSYQYDLAVNIVLLIKQDGKGSIEEVEEALSAFQKADELSPGFQHTQENIAFLEDLASQYYGAQ
ncbi:tetratricopeptide repeat protein [Candidatus Woesearchaeota archaeon]|nr:tetratricopeptide repeat protein [Candidatus Woesearchaeota archaeon]